MIDSTIINDPYIYVTDNVLSTARCTEIIEKFENDKELLSQGITGTGVNLDVKDSKDLNISNFPHWEEEDNLFREIINVGHENYYKHLNNPNTSNFFSFKNPKERYRFDPTYSPNLQILDTGYQIQRTDPGKGYIWHNDFYLHEGGATVRYLTFIFYLNDVEEGWTQFYNGDQVSPRAGRLVFFPATWTYVHQGYPPKQTKYLMTGWMHTQVKPPKEEDGKN